jgi:hypothetical protein
LPFLTLLLPGMARAAATLRTSRGYEAELSILFNILTFSIRGDLSAEIEPAAGRYRVLMTGQGAGVTARAEGVGIIRDGRFKPTSLSSVNVVRGRENRTSLSYDYERGQAEYHSVSHTLFLGRRRQADDVVNLGPGQHVDDLFSAELNFAANKLEVDPDGVHRVTVIRRARPVDEGPDDVTPGGYRAELVTLRFRPTPEAPTGRLTALVDLTGFSSWARATQPARVAFGQDRHLESVQSSMILGTTFTLRLMPPS